MYVKRHRLMKFLALLMVLLVLFKILIPNFFSYTISYFQIIINMVNTDMQRHQDVMRQDAEVVVHMLLSSKNTQCTIANTGGGGGGSNLLPVLNS